MNPEHGGEHWRRVSGLRAARDLHRRLRALEAVSTPRSLLDAVLAEVGIADRFTSIDTPIGTVYVAFAGDRLRAIAPATDDAAFARLFRDRFGRVATRAARPSDRLVGAIQARIGGSDVPIELDLQDVSEFERAVLQKAREIPRGQVRPYGWIAREIGRPGAVRAVGSALHKNPIPLVIPCHRVVRSDGQLGEYALGSPLKRAMLASEGLDVDRLAALARARVRVVGDPAWGQFCYPSCALARGADVASLRPFATVLAARAAGFAACPDCRPAAAAV